LYRYTECGRLAAAAAARGALHALALRNPLGRGARILGLSRSDARDLILRIPSFDDALTVAVGYGLMDLHDAGQSVVVGTTGGNQSAAAAAVAVAVGAVGADNDMNRNSVRDDMNRDNMNRDRGSVGDAVDFTEDDVWVEALWRHAVCPPGSHNKVGLYKLDKLNSVYPYLGKYPPGFNP
jgi:hypothetical protein